MGCQESKNTRPQRQQQNIAGPAPNSPEPGKGLTLLEESKEFTWKKSNSGQGSSPFGSEVGALVHRQALLDDVLKSENEPGCPTPDDNERPLIEAKSTCTTETPRVSPTTTLNGKGTGTPVVSGDDDDVTWTSSIGEGVGTTVFRSQHSETDVPCWVIQPPSKAELSAHRKKKPRTGAVQINEVDFKVVQFACHDHSFREDMAEDSKEATWKVVIGDESEPVDISLHIASCSSSTPRVKLMGNGNHLFPLLTDPSKPSRSPVEIHEDIHHAWLFQGSIQDADEPHIYEFRPDRIDKPNVWYSATICRQQEDGLFELMAMLPYADGEIREVTFSSVDKVDIRRKGSKSRAKISGNERYLAIEVPQNDPLRAVLTIDGTQPMTHYFARPSPAPGTYSEYPPRIRMQVSQDRSTVTTDFPSSTLQHLISGEVRRAESQASSSKCSWTVQLGPFAEHVVEVERRCKSSKVITLVVDGTPFVESSAADIDRDIDGWQCTFRFIGERCLDFDVYEVDREWNTLDTKGNVLQKAKYTQNCDVILPDIDDLTKARFVIDDLDFKMLPPKVTVKDEGNVVTDPDELLFTHNIRIPYKVSDRIASSGLCRTEGSNAWSGSNKWPFTDVCC